MGLPLATNPQPGDVGHDQAHADIASAVNLWAGTAATMPLTSAANTPAVGTAAEVRTFLGLSLLARSETTLNVGSSTPTDVVSFALPTDLAVGDRVIVSLTGLYHVGAAGAYNNPPRVKWYLGSTLLNDTGSFYVGILGTGDRYITMSFAVQVVAVGGSPQQKFWIDGVMSGADAYNVTLLVPYLYVSDGVAATQDLSSAKTLRMEVTLPADDAVNLVWKRQSYKVLKESA